MNVPHDNEWLKIVASTCLGLIAGIIAEPMKNSMTNMRKRREISKAIKVDLQMLAATIPLLVDLDMNQVTKEINKIIDLPAYEHYWKLDKGPFYASRHLRYVRLQCESITINIDRIANEACSVEDGLKRIEECVNGALRSKEMSLYKKVLSSYRTRKSKK